MSIKGLLYFGLELLKCWSKVFFIPIWNCWNVDWRSSLLRFGIFEMLIKGLFYFNLELLKCQSKVFSTLIYTVTAKSQNLELDFNWWVFCCSFAFEMCDLHLSLLVMNFIKKILIDKGFYFWETFDFWNLEVLKLTFKILWLWNFEIFELKFGTWNLKFWYLGFWKLRLEIVIMKSKVWISLSLSLSLSFFFFFFLFF